MNRWFGIGLAVAALVIGVQLFGWKGAILALSVIVFWLLLQFSQLMRVMRTANESPLGHVSSALMLQSRLHPGMTLVQLIKLCRSLGVKVGPDTYRWADTGGDAVEVVLEGGKVTRWTLIRADQPHSEGDTSDNAPAADA
ncbi:hypothetical protein OU995_04195 [Roseateles sp. SL47]|uniref:hypothetical protein n=1 Tax=Roseateles sp. SL47 TaxID=2995138 RepID=UPI002271C035|nr:hypothetical protein [Roseateles sp. SL47]WAC73944.1 hypothetical protein OU995_04195 [Roseateles sp. SL47]